MSRRRMMMLQQTTKTRPELEISDGGVSLVTVGSRSFVKVNEGLAICAIINSNAYILPLLVSTIKSAVSYDGAGVHDSVTSIEYDGIIYYVSHYHNAMHKNYGLKANPYNLPILNEVLYKDSYPNTVAGQEQAAKDLLDYYFYKT